MFPIFSNEGYGQILKSQEEDDSDSVLDALLQKRAKEDSYAEMRKMMMQDPRQVADDRWKEQTGTKGKFATTMLADILGAIAAGPKYTPIREKINQETQKEFALRTARLGQANSLERSQILEQNYNNLRDSARQREERLMLALGQQKEIADRKMENEEAKTRLADLVAQARGEMDKAKREKLLAEAFAISEKTLHPEKYSSADRLDEKRTSEEAKALQMLDPSMSPEWARSMARLMGNKYVQNMQRPVGGGTSVSTSPVMGKDLLTGSPVDTGQTRTVVTQRSGRGGNLNPLPLFQNAATRPVSEGVGFTPSAPQASSSPTKALNLATPNANPRFPKTASGVFTPAKDLDGPIPENPFLARGMAQGKEADDIRMRMGFRNAAQQFTSAILEGYQKDLRKEPGGLKQYSGVFLGSPVGQDLLRKFGDWSKDPAALMTARTVTDMMQRLIYSRTGKQINETEMRQMLKIVPSLQLSSEDQVLAEALLFRMVDELDWWKATRDSKWLSKVHDVDLSDVVAKRLKNAVHIIKNSGGRLSPEDLEIITDISDDVDYEARKRLGAKVERAESAKKYKNISDTDLATKMRVAAQAADEEELKRLRQERLRRALGR